MSAASMTEEQLKVALMSADLSLKLKQSFWETPKAILLIVATTTAIVGTAAGVLGFKLGSQPQVVPQIIFQPGAIQITPSKTMP